jgi:hypothetical protein
MGFLNRLLGRGGPTRKPQAEPLDPPCPHVALVPRWDAAEDMGKADRVSRYVCESCQATFSREEGEGMVAQAAERLKAS